MLPLIMVLLGHQKGGQPLSASLLHLQGRVQHAQVRLPALSLLVLQPPDLVEEPGDMLVLSLNRVGQALDGPAVALRVRLGIRSKFGALPLRRCPLPWEPLEGHLEVVPVLRLLALVLDLLPGHAEGDGRALGVGHRDVVDLVLWTFSVFSFHFLFSWWLALTQSPSLC